LRSWTSDFYASILPHFLRFRNGLPQWANLKSIVIGKKLPIKLRFGNKDTEIKKVEKRKSLWGRC
jgi:hypothetical protein